MADEPLTNDQSADDALEDTLNTGSGQSPLAEDNDSPAQPADTVSDGSTTQNGVPAPVTPLDDTHPTTDSDVQPEEAYDAGLAEAAGASEPNPAPAVGGFNPNTEQRSQQNSEIHEEEIR